MEGLVREGNDREWFIPSHARILATVTVRDMASQPEEVELRSQIRRELREEVEETRRMKDMLGAW